MRRLGAIVPFILVIVVVFLGFAAVGGPLGEAAYDMALSFADGASIQQGDALTVLIGIDVVAVIGAFVISLLAGTSVPSGLPHVALGLFVPLTLAAGQARFFELAGDIGGLADAFGGYNFAAMLVLTIAAAEAGVTLARRRSERRTA
ncbi:MAG TPA: hypothetical protein DCP20_02680 [Coriobacteriia bacterium]|nr:MAG: hypothetical protein XD74_0955 [Actinobacteria bacterium 66_15]HAL29607.1 hypothetical protein [Coriobacteriia bacterium]